MSVETNLMIVPVTPSQEFFITGGTLQQQAPSYVVREADERLYDGLLTGEFCYVLTSRQMGKSSLMIRTAGRLRAAGVTTAILDLTAIGQNVTPEQWYYGLLGHLTRQLGERQTIRAYWQANTDISPLQRWLNVVEEILLPAASQQLVIFVDEIDTVRSLSFATDEFFAGLRQLYNARTERPELARLTFCLLGVAAPADLIRDARLTPFNIGRRVELDDFSTREARLLAHGLPFDEVTNQKHLQRILHWTGGHPYLSQRLCRALAEYEGEGKAQLPAQIVDELCDELFFDYAARERDDNLIFVRERMLRSTSDTANLLTLYGRVRKGERVHDDERNAFITALRLAGITRSEEGWLKPRNRIYHKAFDPAWIEEHMPDAELRRQREAYRRGLWRAGLVAASVVLVLAIFAAYALWQRSQADGQRTEKEALLYAAHMNLLAQDWESNNLARVAELLETHTPKKGETDLRGFEWYYLWRLSHQSQRVHTFAETVSRVLPASDGQTIAITRNDGNDGLLTLLDAQTLTEKYTRKAHSGVISALALSPDQRTFATGGSDKVIKLWDRASGKLRATLSGHSDIVRSLAFAPDGQTLASGSSDKTIRFWSLAACAQTGKIEAHANWVWSIAYSPDGLRLASASEDKTIKLWDMASQPASQPFGRQPLMTLTAHTASVYAVTFSPNGQWLASGGNDNTARVWDAANGTELRKFDQHQASVMRVDFAPNSDALLSASSDNTLRLWNPATGEPLALLKGHAERVWDAMFFASLSGGNWQIVSGSQDQTVQLWQVPSQTNARATDKLSFSNPIYGVAYHPVSNQLLLSSGNAVVFCDPQRQQTTGQMELHQSEINELIFSPTGDRFASSSDDGTIKLWEMNSKRHLQTFAGHLSRVREINFAPDGKRLVSGGNDHTVRLWDCENGNELAVLKDHTRGVRGALFSRDGHWLITASDDKTIRVYDAATLKLFTVLTGHTDGIAALVLSPDGRWLVSGSTDRTAKIWRMDTFALAATLRGHTGEILSLAFSVDSKRLATGSRDRTMKLWDVGTFQELLTSHVQNDIVTNVAFAPNGLQLLMTLRDGNAYFWQAAAADEVMRYDERQRQ